MVRRAQLRACGVTDDRVAAQVAARRWRALNDVLISTHNGPLTPGQARWAGVLSAAGPVALASVTAMAQWGVVGFETMTVHVVVRRGARVLAVPDVDIAVHESRRFEATDVVGQRPPVTTLERATIDAAVWSPDPKTATRIVVAPIQQRLSTPSRIREVLDNAGQVQFRGLLLAFLADLDGGAEALSEVAFLRWCRRHALPTPQLQVRYDANGRRRYLDAVFDTPAGRVIVEIDGGIHLTLSARWTDTAKDNDATLAGQRTLRFPSVAIYADDPIALRQLRAALGLVSVSARHGAA